MSDYSLPKYDQYKQYIHNARNNNLSWEMIARTEGKESLDDFLQKQADINFWNISKEDFLELIKLERQAEEHQHELIDASSQAMIFGEGENNDVTIPTNPKSSWQLYKKGLLEQGFTKDSVDKIEIMTWRILRRLSRDTMSISAVKGLVIGNVQSGKTANMTALMAMAADWGWNFFVVLSGTIENLRKQTQQRMFKDLHVDGNLEWRMLEHLSKKSISGERLQDLYLEEGNTNRYFTVCLKVSSRLKNLNAWLNCDQNKMRQMRVLAIDDEADQAGINTADVTTVERKAVNQQICYLVDGKNDKGNSSKYGYQAMNYIGYTATPYANLLNESGRESLYPKNFIATLDPSKEYFGPQQIFGDENGEYDGLNIVRVLNNRDLLTIQNIHQKGSSTIPKSLEDAICWFLCGAACLRIRHFKRPVSMLVHTSQKTGHHQHIADAIKYWFDHTPINQKIKTCEAVWEKETQQFSKEELFESYPDYERKDQVLDYPDFDDIKKELKRMLSVNMTNIPLDEEGELTYHKGVHLCIDNCKNNKKKDDMYVRLAYPDKDNMPCDAPAFIVVGGTTLSRGLTIEGLISSFFLRATGQADTLMQMGRWFGYRRNYELLPRIWVTEKTREQFVFLSSLDQELRDSIRLMDDMGQSPDEYARRIKNTPKYSFIRITANKRMQSAKTAELDYSGSYHQTILFDRDVEIIKRNKEIVETFIKSLGKPEETKPCNMKHAGNDKVWRNVSFNSIETLLLDYNFQQRQKVFNNADIKALIEWINKITEAGKLTDWNVVLVGNKQGIQYTCGDAKVFKINRSAKKDYSNASIINIGALRSPHDLVADIDLSEESDQSVIAAMNNLNDENTKCIRNKCYLNKTPQLLLYVIDKKSKALKSSKNRMNLDLSEDLFGLSVNIPGVSRGSNYATYVQIDLSNNIFDGEGDLEDTDEN